MCIRDSRQAVVLLTSLWAQHLQQWAFDRSASLLLCGDMNFGPDSPAYQLLTQGHLPESHPDFPHMPLHEARAHSWRPSPLPGGPMQSAYPRVHGAEPDFTNHAVSGHSGQENPFTGTLDFFFFSPDWQPIYAKPLPKLTPDTPYLPTVEEPSDHLLLAATFIQKQ